MRHIVLLSSLFLSCLEFGTVTLQIPWESGALGKGEVECMGGGKEGKREGGGWWADETKKPLHMMFFF